MDFLSRRFITIALLNGKGGQIDVSIQEALELEAVESKVVYKLINLELLSRFQLNEALNCQDVKRYPKKHVGKLHYV